ncbi:PIN-like domain-containing protein [uncultured Sphaerochaeta sp.]|uniref:PIN-like domain-containing protein n=1 Tax=uncultured Sphaerochaeta sp. TaxID=886478 RepID=UPI002A0A512E|nr:PIN-like domain-containing protein [uncultured Sphaerochaeta sp.]
MNNRDNHSNTLIFIDTNILLIPLKIDGLSVEEFKHLFNPFIDNIYVLHTVYDEYKEICRMINKNNIQAIDQAFQTWAKATSALRVLVETIPDWRHFSKKCLSSSIIKQAEELKSNTNTRNKSICEESISDLEPFIRSRLYRENFSYTEKLKLYEQAEFRFRNQIPPGYKDNGKKGIGRYSDFIIWKEMIKATNEIFKEESGWHEVVFITNDKKEDWFSDDSKVKLKSEFEEETGCWLQIMNLKEFKEAHRNQVKSLTKLMNRLQEKLEKKNTDKALYYLKRQLNILVPWGATLNNLADYLSEAEQEVIKKAIQTLPGAIYVIPIQILDLTPRAANCCLYAKVTTVGMFSKMTLFELASFRCFGKKSLQELQSKSKSLIDYFNITGEESIIASITG